MRVRTPAILLLPVWPPPRSLATTDGISVDVFSSPYLDVSVQAVPHVYLLIQYTLMRYCRTGFPHSDISGSKLICSSPKLFAAYHVLHRLLMPRHSPCALLCLTYRRGLPRLSNNKRDGPIFGSLSIRIMQTHLFYQQNCNYPFLPSEFLLQAINVSLLLPSHNLHQMLQCSVFKVHLELSLIETIKSPICDLMASINETLSEKWWAKVDSNHRPHDYQSCALAS